MTYAKTQIMHLEQFVRGKGHFHYFNWKESSELVANGKEYPFILTTGRLLEHYNCGTGAGQKSYPIA